MSFAHKFRPGGSSRQRGGFKLIILYFPLIDRCFFFAKLYLVPFSLDSLLLFPRVASVGKSQQVQQQI